MVLPVICLADISSGTDGFHFQFETFRPLVVADLLISAGAFIPQGQTWAHFMFSEFRRPFCNHDQYWKMNFPTSIFGAGLNRLSDAKTKKICPAH